VTIVVRKRRLMICLALLGLTITAVIYTIMSFIPYSETPSRTEIFLGGVSLILCQPSFLTIPLFDINAYTAPGAILWLLIGLMNSALYAAIGALIGKFRWKSEKL
jgi:hypothetical protein